MTIYRLFQERFAPWDATGAKRFGGRWNSPGRDMLYASSSLALACLEVLVHIRDVYNVPQFSYCAIDVAADLISPWPYSDPRNANRSAPGNVDRARAILESDVLSREFGDAFLAGGRMADAALRTPGRVVDWLYFPDVCAQAVPSIVVPAETNYLLNPNHERFTWLQWSTPQLFQFDPRLLDTALR